MTTPLTRDRVLEAAREMIRVGGLEQFSLRRLAADLGVTAPALYAHVGSKQDLLRGVAEVEFRGLIARFGAARDRDPVERLRALAHSYVNYALESPRLFQTAFLFRPDLRADASGDGLPLATEAFGFASASVQDAIDAGAIRRGDPLVTALTLWVGVHGVATVLLSGPELDADTKQALVDSVIDTLLAGLRIDVGT